MSDGPSITIYQTGSTDDGSNRFLLSNAPLSKKPPLELTLHTDHSHLSDPSIDLTNFSHWIELQPLSTYAGLLELIGNALYRQRRFTEGGEVKHVAQQLRGQHGE